MITKYINVFNNIKYSDIGWFDLNKEINDLVFVDNSSILINAWALSELLKNKKNIVFINEKEWLEHTLTDLNKLQQNLNNINIINEWTIADFINSTFLWKNIYSYEQIENLFLKKDFSFLKDLYSHFREELSNYKTININNRIVNTEDYIKNLELIEKDWSPRYNIIEKINQLISAIMLITIQNLKTKNSDIFEHYYQYKNNNIDKTELIKQAQTDILNINMAKMFIALIYQNLIWNINWLEQKDPKFNLFFSYFNNLQAILLKKIEEIPFIKNIFNDSGENISEYIEQIFKDPKEIDRYIELYNKYPLIYSNVDKLINSINEEFITDFIFMIITFENKLFFSFFEFKDDYKKNLLIYLLSIIYKKNIENYTLSFWDEAIFYTFLSNFILSK